MSLLKDLHRVPKNLRINEFNARLPIFVGADYSCLDSVYTNSKVKMNFIHLTCGNTFLMTPDRLAWGNRCPKCSIADRGKKSRSDKSEILLRITNTLGQDYSLLNFNTEYETTHSYLTIRHSTCNTTYKVMARHILYDGSLCPKCSNIMTSSNKGLYSKSRGEVKIAEILDSFEVHYDFNKIVYDSGKKFVFDFVVYYTDGTFAVIEYDGIQHFDSTKFKGCASKNKINDELKNVYCSTKGIPILRIPYTLKLSDIEKQIRKFLF